MRIIKFLVYYFLKAVVKLSHGLFFRKVKVKNRALLSTEGPLILACNHPNTLVDPLHVASRSKHIVHFLANASLFQSKFGNWFLNNFFCIPIARKQDKGAKDMDNKSNFERVNSFLKSGGCLFIAPEGGSAMNRALRPLKSGTARMALAAAYDSKEKTEVKILPVGLSYNNPPRMYSDLFINVGEPISTNEFEEVYNVDSYDAAKQMTELLSLRMSELVLDTKDECEDQIVNLVMLAAAQKVRFSEQWFDKAKSTVQRVRNCRREEPVQYESIYKDAQSLNKLLQEIKISIEEVPLRMSRTFYPLSSILLIPLAMLGLLINFIPCKIILRLIDKPELYVGYRATAKILAGIIIFPIYYLIGYFLFKWLLGFSIPFFIMLAIGIASGYILGFVRDQLFQYRFEKRLKSLRNSNSEFSSTLESIITRLKQFD